MEKNWLLERFSNTSHIIPTPLTEKRFYYQNTWKDQVTKIEYYTGPYLNYTQNITYDFSGNPTVIDDSRVSKNISLTWEGRGLATYTKGNEALTYRYNDQGIRTYKAYTVNGQTVETTYTLDGHHVLVEERSDGTILYFTYDVDGSLLSMNYNGVEYFYITNIQGDIIELVDISGASVVKYMYDAWGNIIDQTGGSLAAINPYRYRGYRYDEETGWYYLQSRYYNPTIGRFINADGLLGEVGDPLNHNMYAYCVNNPVMYVDPSGYLALDTLFSIILFTNPAVLLSTIIIISLSVIVIYEAYEMTKDFIDVQNAKNSKETQKERSTDKPSWVHKGMVDKNLSAQDNATKMLNDKYGFNNWNKPPRRNEHSKIVKWLIRSNVLKHLINTILDEDVYNKYDWLHDNSWR